MEGALHSSEASQSAGGTSSLSRPRKIFVVGAALLIIGLVVSVLVIAFPGGILLGSSNAREVLPIGGYATIQVYNSQGALVGTWQGHNTLFPIAQIAIAGCLSGIAANPPGFVGCGGYTDLMWIYWSNSGTQYYDLEQTSAPGFYFDTTTTCAGAGCPVWQVQASFKGFTAGNCGTSCTVTGANAGEACASTLTYNGVQEPTSSSTICFSQSDAFASGSQCGTTYSYDIQGQMTRSTTGSCSTVSNGADFTEGANAIQTSWGTSPTLCDAYGSCGTPAILGSVNHLASASQFVGFDTLSPSIAVSSGDTLLLTITYTAG